RGHQPGTRRPLWHLLNPGLADLQGRKDRGPTCRRDPGGHATGRNAEVESAMNDHANVGRVLLVLGLVIAGVGLVWVLAPSIPWLVRLPGDLRSEREHFRFYFPPVTCLLLSLL